MKVTLFIMLVFLFSCSNSDIKKNIKQKITENNDSLIKKDPLDVIAIIKKSEKVYQEKSLKTEPIVEKEFRFIYDNNDFPNLIFIQVNYKKRYLIKKNFDIIRIDGTGKDTLIGFPIYVSLTSSELNKLDNLIESSMFWTLEPNDMLLSGCYMDADLYIYECKQELPNYLKGKVKEYHSVARHSPSNFQFRQLGQYLLMLSETKNNYIKK